MYAPYPFLNHRWIVTIMLFWKKPRARHDIDPEFEKECEKTVKEFNSSTRWMMNSPEFIDSILDSLVPPTKEKRVARAKKRRHKQIFFFDFKGIDTPEKGRYYYLGVLVDWTSLPVSFDDGTSSCLDMMECEHGNVISVDKMFHKIDVIDNGNNTSIAFGVSLCKDGDVDTISSIIYKLFGKTGTCIAPRPSLFARNLIDKRIYIRPRETITIEDEPIL